MEVPPHPGRGLAEIGQLPDARENRKPHDALLKADAGAQRESKFLVARKYDSFFKIYHRSVMPIGQRPVRAAPIRDSVILR